MGWPVGFESSIPSLWVNTPLLVSHLACFVAPICVPDIQSCDGVFTMLKRMAHHTTALMHNATIPVGFQQVMQF